MKCIKSIKATKNTELGVFTRVTEIEAERRVKTGNWAYAPKSEYKTWKNGGNVEEPQSIEETNNEVKVKRKK
jgi:hypothetical protein